MIVSQHKHSYTNAQVIDGEVNLKMGNTSSWFVHARNDIEKFYVKVKAGNRYITDGKDAIHARFLQMKRDLVTSAFEPSTNQTPLKVGESAKSYLNFNPCEYTLIKDNKSVFFDEKKLKNGEENEPILNVHYLTGELKNETITIEIKEKEKRKCDRHKNKIYDISHLQEKGFEVKEKGLNSFSFNTHYNYSYKNDYLNFAEQYLLPASVMAGVVKIETCAYKHSLNIKLYPDVAWAVHFAFDNPPEKYFKDVNIKLQKGLDAEIKFLQKFLKDAPTHLFLSMPDFMNDLMIDIGAEILTDLANKFAFGIHAYHSFDANKKKP